MIAWLDARLGALRATMTPGQRWTALIAIVFAIAVVNFGAPSRSVVIRAQATAPATARDRASQPQLPAQAPVAPYSLIPGYTEPVPEAALEEPVDDAAALPLPPPPRIVLAVRAAEQPGLPGRDDAAMAAAFLASAGFQAPLVTIGPDTGETCERLRNAGNTVIASEGLGAANDCLVAAGATVISFDEAGDRPPRPGSGGVVSTRRGAQESIVDLGHWGVASGALKGRVGLVGTTAARDEIERAAAELKRLGVNVVSEAYLDDGPADSAQTNGAALDFSSDGVEVVIFAINVAQQRNWVAQYRVLEPGARYVVSDVADGIRDETYPAVFDGALAHTSVRVPWFARDHGETPLQLACRQRWETAAGGPMRSPESVRVFAWCQHIELVDSALRASSASVAFPEVIRRLALPSPLTSDLGAIAGGGWGPTADAVLEWRAVCGCWAEQRPFQPRA
ncbi:MAG TPA: hypothetical protein VMZ22_04010 [Acidimicrobiales bacterium]|nr:hypothetical protein [Acidimicrobiales bacterium]